MGPNGFFLGLSLLLWIVIGLVGPYAFLWVLMGFLKLFALLSILMGFNGSV